jgi:hypothetical protein
VHQFYILLFSTAKLNVIILLNLASKKDSIMKVKFIIDAIFNNYLPLIKSMRYPTFEMEENKNNYLRMLSLIDEVFATRNDPNQIQVTKKQMKKLKIIHPLTLTEFANENGPLIWVLMIPTTKKIMDDFLKNKISERVLLERTPIAVKYETIYLCSVTALPEIRRQGITKKLCITTINEICKTNPITDLFVWPFSLEGAQLAMNIADECCLKLNILNR